MKKTAILVALLSSCLLLSCTSNNNNNNTYDIYYPSQFVILEKEYIENYNWADEHYGEYTLGNIIGYLIYIDDEANFTNTYPNIEYVTFDVVIGKKYEDKYDRVPVYEINEYNDRSVVAVADISYTYVQIEN